MTLSQFFDPKNDEHLLAYVHLLHRGVWPQLFLDKLPADVRVSAHCCQTISYKVRDQYVADRLESMRGDK